MAVSSSLSPLLEMASTTSRLDHAQVAVAGFGRVHEERRRAGGGQRGRDLAPDVAALAHAHHDHAAAHIQHAAHRLGKTRRLARGQAQHGGGLDVEGLRASAGPGRRRRSCAGFYRRSLLAGGPGKIGPF
jgi:hypothetical protein